VTVSVKWNISGLKEMENALIELRKAATAKGITDGNLMRNALRNAGRDVKEKMQFLAPESEQGSNVDWHQSSNGKWVHGGPDGELAPSGRLRRSIFLKVERRPRWLNEIVYVGPKAGRDRNDPDGAWYAAIVEMHGGEGGQGKGFMRNSVSREFHARMIAKKLGSDINRVARKIGRKQIGIANTSANRAKFTGRS
jgi:hypothetical protein